MAEEEPGLLICLGIHSNQSTSRGEEDDILAFISGPLKVEAHVWLESNDVLELHDGVLVKLMRPCQLISTVLARYVIRRLGRHTRLDLDASTGSNGWLLHLALVIILDDVATDRVISWSSVELHVHLPLHVVIPLLLCRDGALVWFFPDYLLCVLVEEAVYFLSHLRSLFISGWLFGARFRLIYKVLQIHILIS